MVPRNESIALVPGRRPLHFREGCMAAHEQRGSDVGAVLACSTAEAVASSLLGLRGSPGVGDPRCLPPMRCWETPGMRCRLLSACMRPDEEFRLQPPFRRQYKKHGKTLRQDSNHAFVWTSSEVARYTFLFSRILRLVTRSNAGGSVSHFSHCKSSVFVRSSWPLLSLARLCFWCTCFIFMVL